MGLFFIFTFIFSTVSFAESVELEVLPAKRNQHYIAGKQKPEYAFIGVSKPGLVEIFLPKNRCESGWIRWGSTQDGHARKCRILGRGQTQFGTLEELKKLKSESYKYKKWTLGMLSKPLSIDVMKDDESKYMKGEQAEACLFRPDFQSNGKTIAKRPKGTLGVYDLLTKAVDKKYHRSKSVWGHSLEDGELLPAVRMLEVDRYHKDNYEYKKDSLLRRNLFYIHSRTKEEQDRPLEAQSTWGCPRLPAYCQEEFYEWVYEQNVAGKTPRLHIIESDPLAYSFSDH